MSNKFCRLMTNGYNITVFDNQLHWRPCCLYPKSILLKDTGLIKTELEYLNTVSTWIPECKRCLEQENSSGRSMRTWGHERISGNFVNNDCVSLEVSFDKKCNAACLSCTPMFSSTWEKYSRKHNLSNDIVSITSEDLLQQFINLVSLDKLQFLYILGGEPFYSDIGEQLLLHVLKTHPAPNQITLHYQTNGSLLPSQQLQDYWKKFKTVVVNYSIDDINDRFNYLRWPLTWSIVEQNVLTMINTTDVDFRINSTINPLNVLTYNELESWIKNTIPASRLLHYRAGACRGDLDLNRTPQSIRLKFFEKYGTDHILSTLLSTLPLESYYPMLDYINKHDKLRRLNWRKTFDQVEQYFK